MVCLLEPSPWRGPDGKDGSRRQTHEFGSLHFMQKGRDADTKGMPV